MNEKKEVFYKPDLVSAIVGGTMLNKTQAEVFLNAAIAAIKCAVREGKKVKIKEFLTIETKDAAERQGYNPRTGETITIPAHKRVVAKAKFGAE